MHEPYDLVVENGVVVGSAGARAADVAVRGGKIVEIGGPFPAARERVDARGLHVLPGFWHCHCHFREPGHTHKEDFESGTRAAAAGGVTFCIDMTNNDPHPTTLETFEMKKELVAPKAHVDYALYGGGLYPRTVEDLAKAGAIGIKIFNTRHIKEVFPYISELGVIDHGILYELYEATHDVGLIAAVHHDDPEWVKRLTFRDYIDKGRTDYAAFVDSLKQGYMYGHGMTAGLSSSLYYAQLAGAHLHVLHLGIMAPGAFEMIRHAKFDLGQKVTTELELTSMIMSPEQAMEAGPRTCLIAHSPEAGWKSIGNGVADVLVLEHAPHAPDEIEPGWQDMFSVPLGLTGVQEFVAMVMDNVSRGRLTLQEAVRLCSETPARIYGMYPQKGVIQPGADADFTIVDLNREVVFADEDMHSRTGFTTWRGRHAKGSAVFTIVRGNVVMRDGKVVGEPGFGRFTPGVAAGRASLADARPDAIPA
ncbi:amidohydrolase family protein [Afifella sp. IM 167]|uniref:dihydroorotase n=1 Tax=Afifella sp. IM 167 TaxID=2033586 RepID=UPI001CCEBDC7